MNRDRAIQDYDEAIRHSPAFAVALGNRAIAFETAGQYDRALQDYDEVMRLNPILAKAFEARRTGLSRKRTENERSR